MAQSSFPKQQTSAYVSILLLILAGCAHLGNPYSAGVDNMRRAAENQLREVPNCLVGSLLAHDTFGHVGNNAKRAGLRVGDKLVSYDGQSFISSQAYTAWVRKRRDGDNFLITIQRGNERHKLTMHCSAEIRQRVIGTLERAAAGEWAACLSVVSDLEVLDGINSYWGAIRSACSQGRRFAMGQALTVNEARDFYESRRLAVREHSVSKEGLDLIRASILSDVSWLGKIGYDLLANDLNSQYQSAVERWKVAGASERRSKPRRVTGTCFAANPSGVLVTAYHIVQGANAVRVRMPDGSVREAKLQTFAAGNDVAVLRIGSATPNFLALAPTGSVRVGDRVFTMGYPAADLLGQEPKFTDGSISALSGVAGEASLLQITVPVQPGNSGGPLVNERGEVVGLITSTAAVQTFFAITGTLPQNVNWAVKSDYIRPLFEAPGVKAATSSREEAVQRVRNAICMVEAQPN